MKAAAGSESLLEPALVAIASTAVKALRGIAGARFSHTGTLGTSRPRTVQVFQRGSQT